MRRPHAQILSLALAVLLLGAGCAGNGQTVKLTGEALDALGQQFVTVGTQYNALLDAKKITPEEYRAWADFARQFKLTYPVAVASWKKAGDAKSTQEAAEVILQLKTALLSYALTATAKKGA